MAFNLRNFFEEKLADVNPFDGGKTGATVRAQRQKPAPAQTVSKKPVQQGRLGQMNQMLDRGESFESISQKTKLPVNKIRNYADGTRPGYGVKSTPKPQLFQQAVDTVSEFARKGKDGKNFIDNVGDMTLGNSARLVNTANEGVVKPIVGLAQGKSAAQVRREMDKGLHSDRGGILNTGTFFPTKEGYKRTFKDPQSFVKGFTGAGVGVATEVVPVMRGASLVTKPGLTASQKVIRGAGEGAAYGAAGTAAQQQVYNGELDTKGILEGSLIGATMGGAVPAAAAAAPTVKKGAQKTATTAKTVNKKLEQTANPRIKELDQTRLQMQRAFDVETDPARRAQISKGLTQLNRERKMLSQGGYIAGPGAKGFKKAQNDGLVFEGIDGKPRFEVDDSGAKLNDSFRSAASNSSGFDHRKVRHGTTVGEILDHPKLYEQYPDLKGVKVGTIQTGTHSFGQHKGEYNPETNTIYVNKDLSPDEVKSTLLHELQHATQRKEGFATGGGTDSSIGTLIELRAEQNKKIADFIKKYRTKEGKIPHDKRAEYKTLVDEKRRLEDLEAMGRHTEGLHTYQRLAGEAEARAVQARMNMPMSERYVKPEATKYFDENTSQQVLNKLVQPKADLWRQWYHKADHKVLPAIEKEINANPLLKDAGKSRLFDYYKKNFGGDMSFDEFMNSDLQLYRGGNTRASNNMKSYTLFESKAKRFGDVHSITVKPKDTYGMLGDFSEGEVLVPNSKASQPRSTFYGSLDVPKEDLIIRNGDGKAMSIDPDFRPKTKAEIEEHTRLLMQHHQNKLDGNPSRKLVKENGRFVQSTENLVDEASGGLKRKVQIANKAADRKIAEQVRNATDERLYQAGALDPDSGIASVRKAVRELGGVSSSDWESLPATVKNRNGRALDDLVGEVNQKYGFNFENGDDLAQALIDDMGATPPKPKVSDIRKEAAEALQGSEPIQQIEAERIAAINAALIADKTKHIKVKGGNSAAHEFIAIESGTDSIQLKPMDDNHFMRQDGVVVDRAGKSVGTYVRVDGKDIIAYVGGKPLNITSITGDPNSWGKMNKVTHTMTRLLEANAPNKETFQKVYGFLIGKKQQNEAVMKTELAQVRQELKTREQALESTIPNGISKQELSKDLMRYGERKTNLDEITEKYGPEYAAQIVEFDKWARSVYDGLLERANKELVRFGKDPIPRRNNYYTHFIEPSLWEKFGLGIQDMGVFGKGVSNDINPQGVRGGLPTEIAGRTDEFKPITRFNPFAQTRRGSYTTQDAFGAIDAYLEPIMFNIHMTEPAARARVIEKTFRAADKLRTETLDQLNKELADAKEYGLEDVVKDKIDAIEAVKPKETGFTGAGSFVEAVQEYANSLAGKTNRFDRQVNSAGNLGQVSMKTAGALQRVAGASSIPGNLSSAVAQSLSLPQTMAVNGMKNTIKGIAQTAKNIGHNSLDDPIRKSPFMRVRYTDAESLRKGAVRKYTDAASIPLQTIERAFGEINWYANYATMKAKGFTGDELIRRTDMITEKTLAGRGIGDRPEAFRSTFANTVLQFGLEVNNSRIQFWKEMTPKQKAYFVASAAAMNWTLNQTTGNEYLPDYLDAAMDEFNKWQDDEKNVAEKLKGTGQRIASETAKFVPGIGSLSDQALGKDLTEEIFGKGSNVSRFNEPALTKVPNAIADVTRGIGKAIDSNPENDKGALPDVRRGVVSVLPTGSGINKLLDGAETLMNGELRDKNGKSIVNVDNTRPDNIVKGLAFGKYAINEVRDKFQGIDDGKKETTTKTASGSETAAGKLISEKADRSKKLRDSLSEEDREIMRLSKADRQKLIDRGVYSEAKIRGLENYHANKKKELGYETSTGKSKTKTYKDKYAEAKKEWDKESKNWSEPKKIARAKDLKYLEVKKDFKDDTVDLYYLSKTDVYNFVTKNKNGKKLVEDIVKYGDKLVEAGLITKNKYRDKYGNVLLNAPGTRTSSSGSSKKSGSKGGRKTASKGGKKKAAPKFEYKLDGFGQKSSGNSKQLYDLLKKARMKTSAA